MTTDNTTAISLIREAFASLINAGLIPEADRIDLQPDTVLFGEGSPLDSISFVTLISSVEERIAPGDTDLVSGILALPDVDPDNPHLTVGKLADYMASLEKK